MTRRSYAARPIKTRDEFKWIKVNAHFYKCTANILIQVGVKMIKSKMRKRLQYVG